jgi:hypothetical protein
MAYVLQSTHSSSSSHSPTLGPPLPWRRRRRTLNAPHGQSMCKFLPRHPHTFISVARLLLLLLLPLLLTSRWQENNDRFSAELRDGHTKIPNIELRKDGSRGRSAAKFLSTFFVCFAGTVRNCSGGTYISYSVVPKKNEDFYSCRCFLDW